MVSSKGGCCGLSGNGDFCGKAQDPREVQFLGMYLGVRNDKIMVVEPGHLLIVNR